MTTDTVIDGILEREGGYVDDPKDRGGATNFGITATTLGEWRHLGRPATREEVKRLGEMEARAIYRVRYVQPFEAIPFDELKAQLVDIGVTSGPVTAIKMLQDALGVEADGVIGPRTRSAVAVMPWRLTNNSLIARRVQAMSFDVNAHPEQRSFLRGWVTRAVSFYV